MELKPCPFCGGEAEIRRTNDNHNRPYAVCKFGCFNTPPCPIGHLVTWDYKSEEEAVEAWNRRFLAQIPFDDTDIPIEYFEAGGI